MPDNPRLLGQVRDRIRAKQFSIRTERAFVQWRIHQEPYWETAGLLSVVLLSVVLLSFE